MSNCKFLSVVLLAVNILLEQQGTNVTGYTIDPNLAILYRRGDIHVVREIINVSLRANIVSECDLSLEQQNITKSEPIAFQEKVQECFNLHETVMSVVENIGRESSTKNVVSFPENIKVKFINATKIIRTFSWAKPKLNFRDYIHALGNTKYNKNNLKENISPLTHILIRALDYDRMICNGNCRPDLAFINSYCREESHLPYSVTFTFNITFPVVDPEFLSVSLDPFTLMREVELPCTGNEKKLHCMWKYNGPKSVLVNLNNNDCVLKQFWTSKEKIWLSEESVRTERSCVEWSDVFSKSTLTCYSEDFTFLTEIKRLDNYNFFNCPGRRQCPCCEGNMGFKECPNEVFYHKMYSDTRVTSDYRSWNDNGFSMKDDVILESLMNMNITQPEIPWPGKRHCD